MLYNFIHSAVTAGPAYVDGGAGSMLLQAALAGAFAAAYGLRGAVARLIAAIKGNASSKSETSA